MYNNDGGNQTGYGRGLNSRGQPINPQNQAQLAATGSSAEGGHSEPDNGSFRTFAPDPQKRQQLLQGAQREEELYNLSREQSRLKHVSESGVVGSSGMSEEDVRNQQQREMALSRQKSKAKRDAYRTEEKRREEEENQKLKDAARRKAEQKEVIDKQQEASHQKQLKADRKRRQEAFLSNLERNPTLATVKPSPVAQSAIPTQPRHFTTPSLATNSNIPSRGSSGISEEDVRIQQQKEMALSQQRSKAKRDAYRAEEKLREEEENQKKKDAARRKAEQKEVIDKQQEASRQKQIDEYRKRREYQDQP